MFKQIKKNMKKLFSVLAIAALVSCNSGDSKTEEVKPADSTTTVAPATTDSTMAPAADTSAAKTDSAAAAK